MSLIFISSSFILAIAIPDITVVFGLTGKNIKIKI
jgi:hypothetical protein